VQHSQRENKESDFTNSPRAQEVKTGRKVLIFITLKVTTAISFHSEVKLIMLTTDRKVKKFLEEESSLNVAHFIC